MIKSYTDHSANERTYLAWIRTAIAIMAFGFLIEKFDLFLAYIGNSLGNAENYKPSLSVELLGLGLFILGILIVVAATIRFFVHKKAIESDQSIPYNVKNINLLLSFLIIVLSIFLFVYMGSRVL